MSKKRVLGKGLSALLENADTDITTRNIGVAGSQTVGSISVIMMEQIESNPFNPTTAIPSSISESETVVATPLVNSNARKPFIMFAGLPI